jgi:hypothetical protein
MSDEAPPVEEAEAETEAKAEAETEAPPVPAAAAGLPPNILIGNGVADSAEVASLKQPAVSEADAADNAADDNDDNTWEVPLWASVETSYGGSVSTENILAWSKPQFKTLTVFFSPIYKPSDLGAWVRLKEDLQAAAAKEGFSLVSKGSKGSTAADKARAQVLICARGRVVPASRRENAANNTRPLAHSECCRFRLTIHQDHNVDRYYVKGG